MKTEFARMENSFMVRGRSYRPGGKSSFGVLSFQMPLPVFSTLGSWRLRERKNGFLAVFTGTMFTMNTAGHREKGCG